MEGYDEKYCCGSEKKATVPYVRTEMHNSIEAAFLKIYEQRNDLIDILHTLGGIKSEDDVNNIFSVKCDEAPLEERVVINSLGENISSLLMESELNAMIIDRIKCYLGYGKPLS